MLLAAWLPLLASALDENYTSALVIDPIEGGYDGLVASLLAWNSEVWLIFITLGLTVLLFVFSGMLLFATGFEEYESQYLAAGADNLESLYLSIPAQHLMYLSLLMFVVLGMAGAMISGQMWVGFFMGFPALFMPSILFMVLQAIRKASFENQLPDALDNLKSSVQAGLSVPQSFEVLVHESRDPVRQEFRVVCQELALGVQQADALLNMVARMPLADLRIAVNSINICTEQGGDLPGMLKTTAAVIRDRLELAGKLKAITSQGKMQGLIVAALPLFLIWIIGMIDPLYMAPLLTTVWGWMMIGLVVLLDIIGYMWIRAIVDIEI